MGPRGSSNVGTGGGPDLDNIMSFFDRVSNIEVLGGGRGNGPSHIPDVTLVQNTGAGAGSGNIEPFGISRSSGRIFRGPLSALGDNAAMLEDSLRIQPNLLPQLQNEANTDDSNRMQEEPIRNADPANLHNETMIIEPPRGISNQPNQPTANTNAANQQDDVDSLIQMTTGNIARHQSVPANAQPRPSGNQPISPPPETQMMDALNHTNPFRGASSFLEQFPLTSITSPLGDATDNDRLPNPFSRSEMERLQPM